MIIPNHWTKIESAIWKNAENPYPHTTHYTKPDMKFTVKKKKFNRTKPANQPASQPITTKKNNKPDRKWPKQKIRRSSENNN